MVKIGVLALQGAVAEHIRSIEKAGAQGIAIKKVEQLDEIDGIILPGGESTTISKLMHLYGFMDKIKEFHKQGKPIFGTCAGLILMAKEIEGQSTSHLGLLDVKVERNAFGRQRDSFEAELMMPGVAVNYLAVFIRAPYVKDVFGDCQVLSKYDNKIVAVQQGTLLGTAFHPELTDDVRLHRYFIDMVEKAKNERKS